MAAREEVLSTYVALSDKMLSHRRKSKSLSCFAPRRLRSVACCLRTREFAAPHLLPEQTLPRGEVGPLEQRVLQNTLHTSQRLHHARASVHTCTPRKGAAIEIEGAGTRYREEVRSIIDQAPCR